MPRRIALALMTSAALYTLAALLAPSLTSRAATRSTPLTLAARSGYIVASS